MILAPFVCKLQKDEELEKAFIHAFSFHPFDLVWQSGEEGKRGTGEVFVTPTQVELPKTVHACRATPSVEYASLNPFARRTVFGSGTGHSFAPLRVWQERSPALSSLPAPPCLHKTCSCS